MCAGRPDDNVQNSRHGYRAHFILLHEPDLDLTTVGGERVQLGRRPALHEARCECQHILYSSALTTLSCVVGSISISIGLSGSAIRCEAFERERIADTEVCHGVLLLRDVHP